MEASLNPQSELTLYDDTICSFTGKYFCHDRLFAFPTNGSKVTWLHNGKAALLAIAEAIFSAEHFVWITDWQMGFEVELYRRGSSDHSGRLIEIIRRVIKARPVHVRILVFCEPFRGSAGVYDNVVTPAFERLAREAKEQGYPGSVECRAQAETTSRATALAFSHHQKSVVVDGHTAFLGGIDLTYGRYCGNEFDVVIDPAAYVINDMYNPGATKLRGLSSAERLLIEKGFAKPYGDRLLEEGCQPRQPWQDVHIKLQGPSAVDVHRNFVRRWRSMAGQGNAFEKQLLTQPAIMQALRSAQQSKPGGARVQIVRSVSSNQLTKEIIGTAFSFVAPPDLSLDDQPPQLKQAWEDGLRAWANRPQDNIQNAMINCIRSAENYIYIESQFFISDFHADTFAGTLGELGRDQLESIKKTGMPPSVLSELTKMRPDNTVVRELAQRIIDHINAGYNFHVYVVLPVHPEGDQASDLVVGQQWGAMQTLWASGEYSLIGRIKAALVKKKRNPDDWTNYLTVLNLRSYGATVQYARDPKTGDEDFTTEIGRYVVTEQAYIHSKVMIVDDVVAIIGSANLNDRSLTGDGDTEIAAVIVDEPTGQAEDLGEPRQKPNTRKFARELRRGLWQKHFGFLIETPPPPASPEDELKPDRPGYFDSQVRAKRDMAKRHVTTPLPHGPSHPPREVTVEKDVETAGKVSWQSILDKPCAPETVTAIQAIAEANRVTYETVFTHTPRDSQKTFGEGASYYKQPYPYAVETGDDNHPLTTNLLLAAGGEGMDASSLADTTGVVPPSLQPAYMTNVLMPRQAAGVALPPSAGGRRYITYDGCTVHNVEKALHKLKTDVLGFFVSMPLHWGAQDSGGMTKSVAPVVLGQNASGAATGEAQV